MQKDTYNIQNIVNAVPSSLYYPYKSPWIDFFLDYAKTADLILSDKLNFLSSIHKPDHQNLTGLRLEAQDLSFNWDGITKIQPEKLQTLINYLKSYRLTASSGCTVVFPNGKVTQSGYENINTLKLVSFLSNNLLKLVPLWTKDGINFYSSHQANIVSGILNPSGSLEGKDTSYRTNDIDPSSGIPPSANDWYMSNLVDIILTPMPNNMSVQDTVDLFDYLMPISVKIRNVEAYEVDSTGVVTHTTYHF